MAKDSYIHLALPGTPGQPLVFAFHGTGGSENQMLPIVEGVLPGASIVAPRGDVSEHGAARFFRRTAEGVYDMDDLKERTETMAEFVRAHKEAAGNPKTVGIGYSNGANILASAVFAHPELFDAVVLMHPLIPFQPRVNGRLDGKHILITAGQHDPICPPHLTARLHAHLRAVGADVTLDWHSGGHEIRAEEIEAAKRALAGLTAPAAAGDMKMAEIVLEDKGSKGRYVFRSADGTEAEMTFTKIGEHQIIIDHTAVPDAFRGQGIGVRLVTQAVEDARAQGKKIIPLCPFANAQFRRHPEWADVLKS